MNCRQSGKFLLDYDVVMEVWPVGAWTAAHSVLHPHPCFFDGAVIVRLITDRRKWSCVEWWRTPLHQMGGKKLISMLR